MKILAVRSDSSPDEMHLMWYLSKRCNFDCWYCADSLHDKTSPLLAMDQIQIALQNFNKISFPKVRLSITGGEPYLHSNLAILLAQIHQNPRVNFDIDITSNGSLPVQSYVKTFEFIKALTLSAHFDSLETDSFLSKVEQIKRSFAGRLQVNVMFSPGQLETVQSFAKDLKAREVRVVVRRLRAKNSRDSVEYSDEDEKYFQDFYNNNSEQKYSRLEIQESDLSIHEKEVDLNQVTALNLNSFKGWNCDAGTRYFTIWNDGTLYACEAGYLKKLALGNIFSNQFIWPKTKKRVCPIEKCVCIGDIAIPKERPIAYNAISEVISER